MTKFIATYNIKKSQCSDGELMMHLKENAFKKANNRKFIEVITGEEGDDFVQNKITIHFTFEA